MYHCTFEINDRFQGARKKYFFKFVQPPSRIAFMSDNFYCDFAYLPNFSTVFSENSAYNVDINMFIWDPV